jgi:hypothetical protein
MPDNRTDPPTTAVVQVAGNGTATLYLGSQLVKHAAGVDAATVMQVLVDYAATIDTAVRVTTQMSDGTWTRHWLDPDGSITDIPPNIPAVRPPEPRTAVSAPAALVSPMRTGMRARVTSRPPVIAVLALLVAALVVAAILGTFE